MAVAERRLLDEVDGHPELDPARVVSVSGPVKGGMEMEQMEKGSLGSH